MITVWILGVVVVVVIIFLRACEVSPVRYTYVHSDLSTLYYEVKLIFNKLNEAKPTGIIHSQWRETQVK